jgi:hypothetical protein
VVDAGTADVALQNPVTITLTKTGAGTGTVAVSGRPDTICGPGCTSMNVQVSAGMPIYAEVTLAPGSIFLGWQNPSCAGIGITRHCLITPSVPITVVADFAPAPHNILFVTKDTFTGALGGLAGADGLCAHAATAVGLGGTFVALLETRGTTLADRLVYQGIQPRAFMRLDGLPIADTVDDLVDIHKIYYPVRYDETGNPATSPAWSGAGAAPGDDRCVSFMTESPGMTTVSHPGGPPAVAVARGACRDAYRLVCVEVDKQVALSPPKPALGKLIWLTSQAWPAGTGRDSADDACRAGRPAGAADARALLSTTIQSALARMSFSAMYVRPDGMPVGLAADLAASDLRTGVWIAGDGSYGFGEVYAGSTRLDLKATGELDDCVDWNSSDGAAKMGFPVAGNDWWGTTSDDCSPRRLYCFEP